MFKGTPKELKSDYFVVTGASPSPPDFCVLWTLPLPGKLILDQKEKREKVCVFLGPQCPSAESNLQKLAEVI
jgi:hypothetical protein